MGKILNEINQEINVLVERLRHYKNDEEKDYLLSCLFTKLLLKKTNDRAEKEKQEKEREEKEKLEFAEREKKRKDDLLKNQIKELEHKLYMLKKYKKD